MRGAVAVASALLFTTLLSGCFVEDKDADTDADASTGSQTSTGTTTRTGGNSTLDLAPKANLRATPANGTAPLNVTFAINATDPEGAPLSWSLSLANATSGNATGNATPAAGKVIANGTLARANGTYAPANATHQFTAAGNYTVTLTVRDAKHNVTDVVRITVTGGNATATPAAPTEDDHVVFNADGTCDAKTERSAGPLYVQHRGGDSVWVYEESNGVAGLQVGGDAEEAEYRACANPDTLIF